MKNLIIAMGLLLCMSSFSQQNSLKNDIVMTADGQILQVKVTKVTEDTISFNYPGETVTNEIKSNGVDKIVFASGRTQNFSGIGTNTSQLTKSSTMGNTSIYAEEKVDVPSNYEENTIAIIPLKFVRNGSYDKTLSKDATDYVMGLTSKSANAKGVRTLEKGKAVEKLLDAGVNYEKLRQSSPEELRNVLGTEYLLYIVIDENEKKEVKADFDYLDTEVNKNSNGRAQIERSIGLKVYGADSEVEAYEVDFFETVFQGSTVAQNSNLLSSGKWKSSLRYLTDQLFTSNVFTDQ